jgi:hypothetical protein
MYAVAGGGTWYTGSVSSSRLNSNTYPITASQIFSYSSDKDINMNVSNIIRAWYTGAIADNGFIVKLSNATEFVNSSQLIPILYTHHVWNLNGETIHGIQVHQHKLFLIHYQP